MLTLDPKHLPLKKDEFVLDLGCGEGRHITGLLETKIPFFVVGVDLNKNDIYNAREKLTTWYQSESARFQLIQSDGLFLPFKDNSFDHIICSEVLEHVHAYQSMLREIKRLLKPNGHLCISVPRTWPEKICWGLSHEYHEVEGGHIRIFNASKLKQEINALGLRCYKRHWAHALHSPYWWLKCLFWNSSKDNLLIRGYHKILVWDLMKRPKITALLEKILNPILGKSVVMYFVKR